MRIQIFFSLGLILLSSLVSPEVSALTQQEADELKAQIEHQEKFRKKMNANPQTWYCVRQSQVEVFYDRAERYDQPEKFTMQFNGEDVSVKCQNCYLRDHTSYIWPKKEGGWTSSAGSLRLHFANKRLSAVGLYPGMSHAVIYFADCEKF